MTSTQIAPKTMQEAIDKAIEDHVEGVLFLMSEMNMDKKQALRSARESSCMGDKIWILIDAAVDAKLAS